MPLSICERVGFPERPDSRCASAVEFTMNRGEFENALSVEFATNDEARPHSCSRVGDSPKAYAEFRISETEKPELAFTLFEKFIANRLIE